MKKYLLPFAAIIMNLILSVFFSNLIAADKSTENSSQSFSPKQVKEIEGIISHYLINNPMLLLKATQRLEEEQAKTVNQHAISVIKQQSEKIFNDPNSPIIGNPKGKVQIVEFFDYQCGHCKAMAPIVKSIIHKHSDIKIIYKELPIFGKGSNYAAKAALAAVKQGKYSALHNALFKATDPLTPKVVLKIARRISLNTQQLKHDMKAKWIDEQIHRNFQLAKAIQLMGTPTFIISNPQRTKIRFIPGALSETALNQQIVEVSQPK